MGKGAHKQGGKFQKKEVKEFLEEVIQIDRVTRVVKGGRKLRFRATVVIGNKKGKIGVGIGKSNEVTSAIQKAIAKAKKKLLTVKLDGTTIPHDVYMKYKSSRIMLMPAKEGTGIIAGGPLRKVLDLVGVKDILSKSLGTTNKVTNTKCIFLALAKLVSTPAMSKRAKERIDQRVTEENAKREQKSTNKPKAPKAPVAKKPETKKEA